MDFIYTCATPLGSVTLASDGEALTGLWFEGQKHFARGLDADHETHDLPVFRQAAEWLDIYFSGKEPGFMPPLRPRGSPFQKAAWDALLAIPYGKTVTYGQIADRINARRGQSRTSARAVGGAVGRNPISLLIPCHRVVGADGSLTGYAGGVERKRALLELEQKNIR